MKTNEIAWAVSLWATVLGACTTEEFDEPLELGGAEDVAEEDAAGEEAAEDAPSPDPAGADGVVADEDPIELVTFCDRSIIPPIPIDFAHELLITDLAVVEDPCRTTLTPSGACAAGTVGVWTFAELMTRMSGTVPPQVFVAEWLSTFEVGTTVGGFPVPPRPAVRPALIDPWLIASGCAPGDPIVGAGACPLDLTQAPFRLLAIVNRVDLENPAAGEPGELRFVFGSFDPLVPGGPPLPATFILEYKLPSTLPTVDWSQRFHALNAFGGGSPAYRTHLQAITDDVTLPGVEPGNPNLGSAIGQLRTNDIAFGGPLWKMREYVLQPVGRGFDGQALSVNTTHLNPDDSLNTSGTLDAYLVANEAAILGVVHSVPAPMLGGEASAPMLWDDTGGTGILDETRHLFGFATCSGCHTAETNTAFTHVDVRPAGAPAPLSPFLAVSALPAFPGSAFPAAFQPVPDPAGTGLVFHYNEPWRRVCETQRILGGVATPYTLPHGGH